MHDAFKKSFWKFSDLGIFQVFEVWNLEVLENNLDIQNAKKNMDISLFKIHWFVKGENGMDLIFLRSEDRIMFFLKCILININVYEIQTFDVNRAFVVDFFSKPRV